MRVPPSQPTTRSPAHSRDAIETVPDPLLSLLQSATDALLHDTGAPPPSGPEGARPRHGLRHPLTHAAATLATYHQQGCPVVDAPPPAVVDAHGGHHAQATRTWRCVQAALAVLRAHAEGDNARARTLEAELAFSDCDPRWGAVVADHARYFGLHGERRAIPYRRHRAPEDFVLPVLPPNATVALLADWGTGTPGAHDLLRQIRTHEPDAVLHLGDIYYAATPHEVMAHFLDPMDRILDRDRTRTPVYTLAGNHDVYSGGAGYYRLIDRLNASPRFPAGYTQPASYFGLRTRGGRWQFLAMDTGLHDHDPHLHADGLTRLEATELEWHVHQVREWARQGGRTILLSHHQPFSAFLPMGDTAQREPRERAVNPHLMATGARLKEAGDVAAWFWGHEHNLCIYQPYRGIARGRCIGHGAIPTFLSTRPYDTQPELEDAPRLVSDPRNPTRPVTLDAEGDVLAHGYVILSLDDTEGTAHAAYHQTTDPGTPLFEETF